jgi:hypothetical protein
MCYCQTNLLHGEYSYECNIPDNRTLEMIVLKEEKELIQEGAQRTPMVRLNTWASFNAKTLKVYRNIRNEFVLIFRFVAFMIMNQKNMLFISKPETRQLTWEISIL